MHYLHGPDTYTAREAIHDLARERGATIRWIDREDFEQRSVADLFGQGGGTLFGAELRVVRDVGGLPARMRDELAAAAKEGLPDDVVVWERGEPDKRTALYKALKDSAREFAEPTEHQLASWLAKQASVRGGSITKEASQELVRRTGPNRWRLVGELELLVLRFTDVAISHVREAVPGNDATDEAFAMLDALTAGHSRTAFDQMERILRGGQNEFYILSMLAWQFRALSAVQEGIFNRKTQEHIAKESGLHPFVVKKHYSVAARLARGAGLDGLTRIMAADFAIKQGKTDARTGLVMLMAGLMRQLKLATSEVRR